MHNYFIILVTIVISIASLLYELILAQMMSSIYGGTIFYYILVIGIYVFSLGMGSILYPRLIKKKLSQNLFIVEFLLSIIGASAPMLAVFIDNLFPGFIGLLLNFVLISSIGLLSGIELPLLMDLYNRGNNSYSGKILFFDFFGTFLACIIFPVFLIPYFHLFEISVIIGFLNLSIVFLMPFASEDKSYLTLKLTTAGAILILFSLYLLNSSNINNFIIQNYFLHIK